MCKTIKNPAKQEKKPPITIKSLLLLFLPVFALLMLVTTGFTRAEEGTYLADIIRGAEPDPAFKLDHYKTRRDVLSGIVGSETWVEHFIRDGEIIETLEYNRLVYGVIVTSADKNIVYYALNDDRKTYTLSQAEPPPGWAAADPTYDDYVEKAQDYIYKDRYKDAIEVLEEAIERHGHRTAEVYFLLAVSYDKIDEIEDARDYYKKTLNLNPNMPDALYNLGVMFRSEGHHSEAAKYLERYLRIVPDDPDADSIRRYIDDN